MVKPTENPKTEHIEGRNGVPSIQIHEASSLAFPLNGVSLGCPPLLQRPSALQDVCARTHDIGSHLVSLYDPAHHLAGVGSFVDTSAVAAQSPGRAARSARSAPSRAQVCGCLQPCLGH